MTDTPNTDVLSEARAREVLATEFERSDRLSHAAFVRSGVSNPDLDDVVRAMQAFAKEATPPASDAAVPAGEAITGRAELQDAVADALNAAYDVVEGAADDDPANIDPSDIEALGEALERVSNALPDSSGVGRAAAVLATAPKVASDTGAGAPFIHPQGTQCFTCGTWVAATSGGHCVTCIKSHRVAVFAEVPKVASDTESCGYCGRTPCRCDRTDLCEAPGCDNPTDRGICEACDQWVSDQVASDTGAITPEWCLRMAELEAGQEIGAGALDHPLRIKCELPPAGWVCTREPGHDGPCAAVASDTGAGLRAVIADAAEFVEAADSDGFDPADALDLIREVAALSTDATLSVRSNGEVLEQAADAEALAGYRAAVSFIAADAWDGCSDCIEILRAARMADWQNSQAADPNETARQLARIRAFNTNREDAQSSDKESR